MRGIRGRLTVTLVALVVLTAAVLGIGSYLFVDSSLHARLLEDGTAQARSDLSVLAPDRIRPNATVAQVVESRLIDTFVLRNLGVVVRASDGEAVSPGLNGALASLPPELTRLVAAGQLGYAWTTLGSRPVLVVGGRMPPSGPDVYFVHDATFIEEALGQLRVALAVGTLVLALLALLAARIIARGVLAPVEVAGRAAERIERGDLSARVPVTSRDEFGTWAERFNRMATALGETIERLEASQAQNRRFVADVSHELRTPLTALVAEASILRDHLDELPAEARRAGELLVADVRRFRTLVEELMELSRFDAAAEQATVQTVDVGRLVAAVVARRLPEARLSLPDAPLVVRTDPRRLERIVGNLLDNVAEHAPGAPAEVTLAAGAGTIRLTVADGGPGVPAADLRHIFERFYKADPSRRGGSSGLGLAIAREHADLLGGELRAANQAAGGLVVELRLPVTEPLPDGDEPEKQTDDREAPKPPAQESVR